MDLTIFSSSYPRDAADSRSAGVFVADFARRVAEREGRCTVVTPQRTTAPGGPVTLWRIPWPGGDTSLTHLSPKGPLDMVRLTVMMVTGAFVSIRAARRADHVLAMWAVPSGIFAWLARKLTGTRYSVWALGSDIWRIDDYPFGRRILRRVLRDAHRVYANSSQLRNEVRRVIDREVQVLPTSRLLPAPAHTPLVEAFDPAYTNFLTVARFHEHKGLDVLLEAVSLIPIEERASMRFHVFGGGPEEALIRERHRALGLADTVRLGGYVGPGELSALLGRASCLVIPSRIESLPVLLGDAIQRGCPLIATDVGDLGTLVRRYEVGATVPPGSAAALAEALRAFGGRDAVAPDGMRRLEAFLSLNRSVEAVLGDAV